MAGFVIYDGYKSSSLDWLFYIIFGIGVIVASLVAWHFHKAVVTVRIDADRISYATGRGEPQWITARWSELKNAVVKIQTTKKSRTEWMEIIFPDGKIRKIPSDVMDYSTLRDTVSEFYARCHQT